MVETDDNAQVLEVCHDAHVAGVRSGCRPKGLIRYGGAVSIRRFPQMAAAVWQRQDSRVVRGMRESRTRQARQELPTMHSGRGLSVAR